MAHVQVEWNVRSRLTAQVSFYNELTQITVLILEQNGTMKSKPRAKKFGKSFFGMEIEIWIQTQLIFMQGVML